jgi:hypothetical protein
MVMRYCINADCSRSEECARFDKQAGFKQPVLYPDGGDECGKFLEKEVTNEELEEK